MRVIGAMKKIALSHQHIHALGLSLAHHGKRHLNDNVQLPLAAPQICPFVYLAQLPELFFGL